MLSHKHRCIFVHIPKCAGTSVEATFENLDGVERLLRCRGLFNAVGEYPDYFRFTIVRNPLSRAASAWGHSLHLRMNNAQPIGLFDKAKRGIRRHVYSVRCFEEYLELIEVYLRNDGLYDRLKNSASIRDFGHTLSWQRLSRFDVYHVLPQVYFTQELQPHVVCKLENLEEDWKIIQTKLEIQGTALGWMRSPGAEPANRDDARKWEFSSSEIELVRKIYSDDYFTFNYL